MVLGKYLKVLARIVVPITFKLLALYKHLINFNFQSWLIVNILYYELKPKI